MRANFDRAFDLVVGSEGGYDNDPDDRGNWVGGVVGKGELRGTKYGIDAASHPTVDIKNLTLAGAKAIYLRDYWGDLCNRLPSGVDYIVFDMSVNNGRVAAIKLLQRALGVPADGIYGPKTQEAATRANGRTLINDVSNWRTSYYHSLKMFWKYGRGWLNRVERVRADAIAMLNTKGLA